MVGCCVTACLQGSLLVLLSGCTCVSVTCKWCLQWLMLTRMKAKRVLSAVNKATSRSTKEQISPMNICMTYGFVLSLSPSLSLSLVTWVLPSPSIIWPLRAQTCVWGNSFIMPLLPWQHINHGGVRHSSPRTKAQIHTTATVQQLWWLGRALPLKLAWL